MSWGQYLPPGFIVTQRDSAGKAPSLGADPQVHRVSSGLFLLLLSLSFLTREMEMKLQDTQATRSTGKTCLQQRQVFPVVNWVTACARGIHVSLVRGPPALPSPGVLMMLHKPGRAGTVNPASGRKAVTDMLSPMYLALLPGASLGLSCESSQRPAEMGIITPLCR